MEAFDDHPYADEIDLEEFEIILAEDDAIAQRIMGGDIDFRHGLLSTHIGDADEPENVENIVRYDDSYMRNVKFFEQGPGQEHMRKIEVRRAIAHILDRSHISDNYTTPSTPREQQTGLTSAVTEEFTSDGFTDNFIDYPVEANEERAEELMEEQGTSVTATTGLTRTAKWLNSKWCSLIDTGTSLERSQTS